MSPRHIKLVPLLALVLVTACLDGEPARQAAPSKPGTPSSQDATPIAPVTASNGAGHPYGLKWGWDQLRASPALQEFAKSTNGGATFFETEWCQVEPSQGHRDWSELDDVASGARGLGYKLFLKIRVGSCWTTGGQAAPPRGAKGKTPSAFPTDLGAYKAFVRALVQRYSARGVNEYAIENEVNAANFWAGSTEEYVRLVETGAKAVHAADPDAVVLDAGIASPAYGVAFAKQLLDEGKDDDALALYRHNYVRRFETGRGRLRPVADVDELRSVLDGRFVSRQIEFLKASMDLARRGIVDAFQLHYYEPWDDLGDLLSYVRRGIGASTPIEAWEVGFFWPGSSYDETLHAREMGKLYSTLLAGGVRRIIYLPLAPGAGAAGGDAAIAGGGSPQPRGETWRGLATADGSFRPASDVYLRLVAAAKGATTWSAVSAGTVRGVAFDNGNTSTKLVLWSDRGAAIRLAPVSGSAAAPLLGGTTSWTASGFRLGPDPIVVTLPSSLRAAIARILSAT